MQYFQVQHHIVQNILYIRILLIFRKQYIVLELYIKDNNKEIIEVYHINNNVIQIKETNF